MCQQIKRHDCRRGRSKSYVNSDGDDWDYADWFVVKYVALLAFHRIVASHSHLVSMHQDVIMDCIDDPDISIRLQALDLGMRIVNSDSLVSVIQRLIQQLQSQIPTPMRTDNDAREMALGIEATADSDDEGPEELLKPTAEHDYANATLPAQYRIDTMLRIIEVCSKETYENIVDFEWYLNTLMQMLRLAPVSNTTSKEPNVSSEYSLQSGQNAVEPDITSVIGWELRNIAVRVEAVRADTVTASYSLMTSYVQNASLTSTGIGGNGVLAFAAWIVGEYFASCGPSDASLEPFIHSKALLLPPNVIIAYLQAIPKVFASLAGRNLTWSSEDQTMISLLATRVVHFLDPLRSHSNIEVQERSVELFELMRVITQALANHEHADEVKPLVLTTLLPELFSCFDLNPVAPTAQRKVPLPAELDLETPINKNLATLLHRAEIDDSSENESPQFDIFYNQRPAQKEPNGPAFDTLPTSDLGVTSYQQSGGYSSDNNTSARKSHHRRERNKDDPFYIGNDEASSGVSTPFHDILRGSNDGDLDVDSIPIMDLDLGDRIVVSDGSDKELKKPKKKKIQKVHITKDENIVTEAFGEDRNRRSPINVDDDKGSQLPSQDKIKKSLLQVDSSGLSTFSLAQYEDSSDRFGAGKREFNDEEMAKALAEVERSRLEMQRASERVQATDGTPSEGTLVKKKKKKKKAKPVTEVIKEKNERSSVSYPSQDSQDMEAVPVVQKRKKRRKSNL